MEQLDKMLEHADVDSKTIKNLGDGMKKLSQIVQQEMSIPSKLIEHVSDKMKMAEGYHIPNMHDWDHTPLEDQACYFNEKNLAYTWDKSTPSVGDFPPGRLDFVFFTNSVMSVDKSFIISTEHMSQALLNDNNLLWNDTKEASDHLPIIVDFILPTVTQTGIMDNKTDRSLIHVVDLLGRIVHEEYNKNLLFFYDDGSVEKNILIK